MLVGVSKCRRVVEIVLMSVLVAVIGYIGGAQEVEISFYTSAPLPIARAIVEEFEQAHPDIKVSMFRGGTGAVVSKVRSEAQVGEILADIVHVADITAIVDFKRRGWLVSYESPVGKNYLSEDLIDKDYQWYVGRIFFPVLVYRSDGPHPPADFKSWSDLSKIAGPELSIPSPLRSGTIATFMIWTFLTYGDDVARPFWLDIDRVGTKIGALPETALNDLLTSEADFAITTDLLAEGAKVLRDEPIGIIYPQPTPYILASSAIINRKVDTRHAVAVLEFFDFFHNYGGQQFLANEAILSPLIGIKYPEGRTPLEEIPSAAWDVELGTDRRSEILEWWEESIGK